MPEAEPTSSPLLLALSITLHLLLDQVKDILIGSQPCSQTPASERNNKLKTEEGSKNAAGGPRYVEAAPRRFQTAACRLQVSNPLPAPPPPP